MVLGSDACTRPSVLVNVAIASISVGLIPAVLDISIFAADAQPDKVLVEAGAPPDVAAAAGAAADIS